jgi:AGZA family xanthine/uracil permease-like MFS transporter
MSFLERRFRLVEAGTTARREVVAGLTTFATLSYILFVQPAVLSACGMDAGGVLFATCVASAVACVLMALWTNYPIALAPGMGTNFFFAYAVCLGRGFTWQQALAANLIAGALFLALTGTGFRERVMEAIPAHLKHAIAAGIGLLIALVGLEWGGLIVAHPVTYVQLGELGSPVALLALFGLALSAVLLARGVVGALLIGLLSTALVGWGASAWFGLATPLVQFAGVIGAPPSPAAAFQLDFSGLFARPLGDWLAVLGIFFLLDLFDSIGTLVGVGQRAGLMVAGKLPKARGALAADATGTVLGAALGTSTVTSYVESAAGVASGGRTGLVAVVVAACLLLSLVFTPLLAGVGAGVEVAEGVVRYPVIAPVLILIGAVMATSLAHIEWKEVRQSIPAFLTLAIMPLTVSITEGIAWGFVATSLLDLTGKDERRVSWLVHFFAVVFVLRYVLL